MLYEFEGLIQCENQGGRKNGCMYSSNSSNNSMFNHAGMECLRFQKEVSIKDKKT